MRQDVLLPLLLVSLCSLFLFSCGVDKGHFRVEGTFKSFNQGELYIYATNNGMRPKMDTISVKGGRFIYQTELENPTAFVIVFPNFSELPVFGESGKLVKVDGDASHLKETEVKGTEENELMTAFRLSTSNQTPPETAKSAAQFVKDHPATLSSVYLLEKYFICSLTPDYQQAAQLAELMAKAQPDNEYLKQLGNRLRGLQTLKEGATLPQFTATDLDGHFVTNADLNGKINVINTWSTWNYESQSIQRKLHALQLEKGSDLKIVSFCIEPNDKDCRRWLQRDSVKWSNVCYPQMWETPALIKLGLSFVPDNIITDRQGRVIAHSLSPGDLDEKLKELLK